MKRIFIALMMLAGLVNSLSLYPNYSGYQTGYEAGSFR